MIGRTISHYKILAKLGEGGMGVVYKAEDTKLKRTVALKFLTPDLTFDDEAKERFLSEARAAAALNHPNICTVHAIEEAEGHTFIAMEYVEGRNLTSEIQSGPLRLDDGLDIAVQVGEGLRDAHEKGIVHRDIKPANILITPRGLVKIMDFGLAKLGDQARQTETRAMLGTVAYMSPEQTRGEEVDHRTDIWSLGVVVYEMVAGQRPFKGDYEQAIVYSILNQDPEPVSGFRKDVPVELEEVLKRAMAKTADKRYQRLADLLADLKSLEEESEPRAVEEHAAAAGVEPSIAVLPFANLSADPEQEYFCDGIAEEIINALTHVEGLRVVARTSAFAFRDKREDIRDIGTKLNVKTLLEGSVRKAGNRLRIAAQLINVADGYHLWSDKYDRDIGELCCPEDIFAIQDGISLAIVENLRVKLLKEEEGELSTRHTDDLEAYSLYLKGVYFWNKRTEEGLKTGLGYFQQAVEKDPSYALAYAGIADSYNVLAGHEVLRPRDVYPKARAAAMKALEIDPMTAGAHNSLAVVKWENDRDFVSAEKGFKRAIELKPGCANSRFMYAQFLVSLARYDEAIAEIKRAEELDPLSLIIGTVVGWVLYYARRYGEAIEQYRKVLEMDPNFLLTHQCLGMAYLKQGLHDQAVSEFQKAVDLSSRKPMYLVTLAYAYAVIGRREEAHRILDEVNRLSKRHYVPAFSRALIHTGLGEKEKAFSWLEKAVEERYYRVLGLKMDPDFDSLRSDPRFAALLKKMGIPET